MRTFSTLTLFVALTACGDSSGGISQNDLDDAIDGLSTTADVDGAIDGHAAVPDAHHAPVNNASALTTGTLDLARLPIDVVLGNEVDETVDLHTTIADAHHTPVTNASALSSGTLAEARLPGSVVLLSDLTGAELEPSGAVGDQITDFNSRLTVTSAGIELLRITVAPTSMANVAVNGHVYLEKAATTGARFEAVIRLNSCAGPTIGRAMWRGLNVSTATGFTAHTLAVTGFAPNISSPTDILLCGDAVEIGVSANAYMRGLVATW